MIVNDVSPPLILEILPNEVLFEIFEYLSIQDISRTFVGLNCRFESLFKSDLFPPNLLFLNWNTDKEYDKDQTFVRLFAHRIVKLVIVHHCRADGDRLRPLDLANFGNVRSLTIENPTVAQCQKVHRLFLPHLEHLTISNKRWLFNYDDQSIDLHLNSFPRLRTLHIDHTIWSIKCSPSDPLAQFLRSVNIRTSQPRLDYLQILSICPNLVRLKLIFGGGSHVRFGGHLVQMTHSIPHLNLRRLDLDAQNCLSSALLDILLTFVPNLTHLTMIDGPFVDRVDILADILKRRTVHLQFLCVTRMILSHDRVQGWTHIKSLHPLFLWIVRSPSQSIGENTRLTIISHKPLK